MISLALFMVAGRQVNDHDQDQHRDQHQHQNQHRHQDYSLEIIDDDNNDTAIIAIMTTIATATIVTTDIALTFADYVSVKNRDARRFERLSGEMIHFIEEIERGLWRTCVFNLHALRFQKHH